VCAVRVASGRPLQTPVIQNDQGERERDGEAHVLPRRSARSGKNSMAPDSLRREAGEG